MLKDLGHSVFHRKLRGQPNIQEEGKYQTKQGMCTIICRHFTNTNYTV